MNTGFMPLVNGDTPYYPRAHFSVAKWGSAPNWEQHLSECLKGLKRHAPVDLWVFPDDSEDRFVGPKGQLAGFEALERKRFPGLIDSR
jgi:hypothetical protein